MGRRLFLLVAAAALGIWATTPFASFLAAQHPVWSVTVELLYPVAGLLAGMGLAPARRARPVRQSGRVRT